MDSKIATKEIELIETLGLRRPEQLYIQEFESSLNFLVGEVIGKGAIPVKGRERYKSACTCCLIDPEGPNEPKNRLCTTHGAIGTLSDREEQQWCDKIIIVPNGRCKRAARIREAAKHCKEVAPHDVREFFSCFATAFEPEEVPPDIFAAVK